MNILYKCFKKFSRPILTLLDCNHSDQFDKMQLQCRVQTGTENLKKALEKMVVYHILGT